MRRLPAALIRRRARSRRWPSSGAARSRAALARTEADQVVVRYRAGTTRTNARPCASAHGLTKVRGSANGRTELVVAEGRSPATARRQLAAGSERRRRLRRTAGANWPTRSPTSPTSSDLWGLHNTGQTHRWHRAATGIADVDIDGLEALRIARGKPRRRGRGHRRRRRLHAIPISPTQPGSTRARSAGQPGSTTTATATSTT